jgi:hypothetical protein
MPVKIENATEQSSLPPKLERTIESVLASVPREHLRGLERIRFVGQINHPRLRGLEIANLPGLYHPKQGPQPAWLEISLEALLPTSQAWHKRLLAKLSLKSNLATLLFSLIGQHHFLTLRHSYKKTQLEPSVRAYTLERWAKNLQRRSQAERKGRR